MSKIYKMIISSMLILVLSLSFVSNSWANSSTYKAYIGEVIEIIDGEAFLVQIYDSKLDNPIWRVRLAGIDTNASADAYEFVKSYIQDSILIIKMELEDNSVYIDEDGWSYANIYVGNDCINEVLLLNGLAHLDTSHSEYYNFPALENSYIYAQDNGIGMFGDYNYYNPYLPKVNINTATSTELDSVLYDTDLALASKINSYVAYNKINSKQELKFISEDITNEWLENNKNKITLVTNLNTAEQRELESLFSTYKEDDIAENIIDYRMVNQFTDIAQLGNISGVTSSLYDSAKDFVSLRYETVLIEEDAKVVNINTASTDQIDDLPNMSTTDAKQIIKYRYNEDYSYKTKEELTKIPSGLSLSTFNKIEDNIVISTDINVALEYELESLFGQSDLSDSEINMYAKRIIANRPYKSTDKLFQIIPTSVYYSIKDFIHIGEPTSITTLNINLASDDLLQSFLGLSEKEAEIITDYTKNSNINYYEEIHRKIDLTKVGSKISLYTNINNANLHELTLLHEDLTETIGQQIIDYRNEYPFASFSELEEFFRSIGKYNLYKDIEDFIVFR